jgi:WhiB family redox-sensing transcriptional regulator
MMPNWTWQRSAACRGEDLYLFFGREGESRTQRDQREATAKSICGQCPVRSECLSYALSKPERYGFWAGLGEDERASERRRRMRRAATAGVSAV